MRAKHFPVAVPLAIAFLIVVAPAASAQSLPLPDPGAVIEDVGDTAGSATTDPVGTVTGTVEGTINDPTAPLPDPIEGIVDDTTEPVTDPVEEAVDEVRDSLKGAGGEAGTVVDEVLGDKHDGATGLVGSSPAEDRHERRGAIVRGVHGVHREAVIRDPEAGASLGTNDTVALISAPESDEVQGPSLFQQGLELALKGLVRAAFPLVLALLVGAFIALHGRVGRKDPKLASAPLDASQNTLTFR